MCYDQGNKKAVLSFGLGSDVPVNSLIGIPTLRQWGGVFDFGENKFVARSINNKIHYDMNPRSMYYQQMLSSQIRILIGQYRERREIL